jgi:predicted amidohydrolase
MHITIAIAQFPVSLSISSNLATMCSLLENTQAGDLVVFPEGAVSGYATDLSFLDTIQPDELNAALARLQNEAVRHKITVWAGVCIQQDGQWFNAAYGFTPEGHSHVYHKINLANHERGTFTPGDRLPAFEIDTGAGMVTVGVQICRELRFPEQWGLLARRGAQVFVHLNNAVGDDRYQPVWKSHLVSRAAETQRFVASANNAAPQQISPTILIGPDGLVIGEIVSAEAKTLCATLDLSQVSNLYISQSRRDVVNWEEDTFDHEIHTLGSEHEQRK